MRRGTYSALEIVRIWRHGCGNTIPFRVGPWRCRECSVAMLGAACRSLLRLHWWGAPRR